MTSFREFSFGADASPQRQYASLLSEDSIGGGLEDVDEHSHSRCADVPLDCSLPTVPSNVGEISLAWKAVQERSLLQRMRLAGIFFVTALCWGSSLLFVNKCLPKVDPCSIGLMRSSIACTLLLLFHFWKCFVPIGTTVESRANERREFATTFTSRKALVEMAVLGIIFSGICTSAHNGPRAFALRRELPEVHISGGLASIILMLEPLVCPFLALLLPAHRRTERVDRFTVLGMIVGTVGTGLSIYPSVAEGGNDGDHIFSICACILGSLGFAVGTVLGQYFSSKRPVFHRVTGQLGFGALFLLPVTSILRSQGVFSDWSGTEPLSYLGHVGYEPWLWLLLIGSVCTVGSWFLFYVLLLEIGSLTTTVNFLIPPVAIVLGAAFHNEWAGVSTGDKMLEIGGMIVVLIGVALVIYSAERHAAEKAAPVTPPPVNSFRPLSRDTHMLEEPLHAPVADAS